jgi:hypothetical protein
MAINPALDQFPTEALAIGKMVASFGEIELLFGLLAGSALRNQNLALRAMYRIRSTGGRIDLADVLMRDVLIREGFQAHYEETLGVVRHCLKIRNQYAHCHWSPGTDGLFFTNLEEAANRAEGFTFDHKHVDLTILKEQEAFFDHAKDLLLYLGQEFDAKTKTPGLPFVLKPPTPNLHNLASLHIPQWLGEDGKRRHLERALEAEGRAPPREWPPSVLRLTREEWAAKDRKDQRTSGTTAE